MSDKSDLLSMSFGDNHPRRPKWNTMTTEEAEAVESYGMRPIRLLTNDGVVFVGTSSSEGELKAHIAVNDSVIRGVDLKQCGALIEALCEAEWYLIGPMSS